MPRIPDHDQGHWFFLLCRNRKIIIIILCVYVMGLGLEKCSELSLTCCSFDSFYNIFGKNLYGSIYSGRGKFMPLPLKSKILETPGSLATDDIKMFLL
jgi:hypothetical protein